MELTMPFEYPGGHGKEEVALSRAAALDAFLRSVEARAFRIAQVTVRDRDEALDIVQDSMLKLVTKYPDRPADEWPPLFFRILTNRVRDWHRRSAVRNRVLSFFGGQEDNAPDPIVTAPGPRDDDPVEVLIGHEAVAELDAALRRLPERQRQAFMLRNFENLDVRQTALAMGCSDGSVKTHHSRAIARLRELLGEEWS
jgi:RNA polymerase sigma-70 factor (ECF subfamily)